MKKSAIVDINSYVISLWLMLATAWLSANYCGQSRSFGYICTLVLVPRIFSSWGRVTHLGRGIVRPSGIREHVLLMGFWDQMDSTRIYTPLQ